MKLIRNFFRHIRDSFRNLFRNGWMTTASILAMTVTMFMVGSLVLVFANVQKLTNEVEQEIQVRVNIDPVASEADEETLGEEIASIEFVEEVIYRSKEDELAEYQEIITENFDELEGDSNPLNNMYLVHVTGPQNIEIVVDQINALDNVLVANLGSIDLSGLINAIEVTRYVLALLAAVFVVIAVLLISNTIRLTIYARQTEIEIMRLVGAKNSFIRAPFVYEGATIGLIGSAFAIAVLYAVYQGLQNAAGELFAINTSFLIPTMPSIIFIGIGIGILGILLGVMGARRSVRKLLVN
ncbi:permease-like cell division protein FtsX [Fundicoccus ignavus]|uniref:Cell division protein FtsX n=1 Tax=Fundicoccus ignavus TaxID=2664442 RepID=A0A6I2GQ95_9LACT|nr:permease-like cell division protein FtsX [Fundicoccus ignavus]MRI82137.1 FtsX-like permease family protein [Fundicoccus ignavus]MRI85615.1 FtsX-like permease family protein [Fundicoccus ignavus]MRJ47300.1 FtsX-like permease family protein [Fundicoccus ignavus]